MFPEEQAGRQWQSLLSLCSRRASAALAGLHHHVRELLHLGGPPDIVQDGQGLQVLGYAARGGRGFRVQGVVQSQHLGREASLRGWKAEPQARGPGTLQDLGAAPETEHVVNGPLVLLQRNWRNPVRVSGGLLFIHTGCSTWRRSERYRFKHNPRNWGTWN